MRSLAPWPKHKQQQPLTTQTTDSTSNSPQNVKEVNELPPTTHGNTVHVRLWSMCVWAYFTAKVAAHKRKNKTNSHSSPACSLCLPLAGNLLAISASLLPLKLKLKTVQTFFTTPNRKQNRRNVLGCPFECWGNNTRIHQHLTWLEWLASIHGYNHIFDHSLVFDFYFTLAAQKESWQFEPSSMAAILRASVAWLSTEGSGE